MPVIGCIGCGGIFCESCCCEPVSTSKSQKTKDRSCVGCRLGECPGENVKRIAEANCTASGNNANNLKKSTSELTVPATAYHLIRGSLFPEEEEEMATINSVARAELIRTSNFRKDPLTGQIIPPVSGYFEFVNKAENEVCCIKVLKSGNHNNIYEAPRPSYMAIPPLEYVHVDFDPEANYIDLLVLYHNVHSIPTSRRIVYDTTPEGSLIIPVSNISACANVENFKHFIIYRIPCRGCNVLLKYKGDGVIDRRLGTSIARVGVFSSFTNVVTGKAGKAGNKNLLDMNSNVKSLTLICNSKS